MKPRTAKEVKAELARAGLSVPEWASANGIKPFTVYQLLDGKSKGLRGEAHRAAVLLGMKAGVLVKAEELNLRLDNPLLRVGRAVARPSATQR